MKAACVGLENYHVIHEKKKLGIVCLQCARGTVEAPTVEAPIQADLMQILEALGEKKEKKKNECADVGWQQRRQPSHEGLKI